MKPIYRKQGGLIEGMWARNNTREAGFGNYDPFIIAIDPQLFKANMIPNIS